MKFWKQLTANSAELEYVIEISHAVAIKHVDPEHQECMGEMKAKKSTIRIIMRSADIYPLDLTFASNSQHLLQHVRNSWHTLPTTLNVCSESPYKSAVSR